jgi:hypothetical protein
MMKIAAALASVPLALTAAVAGTGIVVVDVEELGPGGHHIVVPMPLLAIRTAAALVPSQGHRLDLGEAGRHLGVARDVLQALADAPDGELVRVEEPEEHVVIAKEGGLLRVRVHDQNEDVTVAVPLAFVLRALPEDGGTISPSALVGALGSARFTDLVDVRTADEHVRVTVY